MNREEISELLPAADALLVVPPFANPFMPCLGLHVLQSYAGSKGLRVAVYYANLEFALRIGEVGYVEIPRLQPRYRGEQIFARAAYGTSSFDQPIEEPDDLSSWLPVNHVASKTRCDAEVFTAIKRMCFYQPAGRIDMDMIERNACTWADDVAWAIAEKQYRVVGCTTMFYQTAAAVSLLKRVKQLNPDTLTVIGGPNCDGEMAEGIASLSAEIDSVFSGESEESFASFLRDAMDGRSAFDRIITGTMSDAMDQLPCPDYEEYFIQRRLILPSSKTPESKLEIPYEVSRGCWWGDKRPCKFCGLNGPRAQFRAKSPEKVVGDLKSVLAKRETRRVRFVDNVIPNTGMLELMKALGKEAPNLDLLCEVRPNLSFRETMALRRGGATMVQVGIESLSDPLLRRMGKGVTVRQNLAFLRYARIAGMRALWNLLWGFPGDEVSDYTEMRDLMPLLRHLYPASNLQPLSLDRFSTYYEHASDYGITNLRPQCEYAGFLPPHTRAEQIDSHFVGEFDCGAFSDFDVIVDVYEELKAWRSRWTAEAIQVFGGLPSLHVSMHADNRYRLEDTRGLPGIERVSYLDRREAEIALVAHHTRGSPEEAESAIARNVAVERNGWLIPLATADAELLAEMEERAR